MFVLDHMSVRPSQTESDKSTYDGDDCTIMQLLFCGHDLVPENSGKDFPPERPVKHAERHDPDPDQAVSIPQV